VLCYENVIVEKSIYVIYMYGSCLQNKPLFVDSFGINSLL